MSRRLVARASIAAGLVFLAAEVVAVTVTGRRVWPLASTTVLSALAAIGGGPLYLRSVRGRPAKRRSSDPWRYAVTFGGLCELTARWIEGAIPCQPGYHGPSDIEDPAMVPVLTRLNRAGFMTTGSQAAVDGPGYDGAHWQQRAAVEGFADGRMASRLAGAAQAAGLTIVLHCPDSLPRWRYRYGKSVTVTTRNGERRTGFGVQVPRSHIRSPLLGYGICHQDAVKALCSAWQVTVIDPEWGRADLLWQTLDRAIAAIPGTGCRP